MKQLDPNITVLDNHKLIDPVEAVLSGDHLDYNIRRKQLRQAILERVVLHPSSHDRLVVFTDFQSDNELGQSVAQEYASAARDAGRPFLPVYLTCGLEANIERVDNAERVASGTTKLLDQELLRDMRGREIPSLVLYSLVFFLSKHDVTVARDKTPGTGGQRVYCPFCYFAFFASVLRLKTLLSSRPYHTYLMHWTIPFCRMKIPTSSLGSEPIYPAPLPTPPIPLTAQVCTSSNSRPTRRDHGNRNSPSWVFQTGHPYCPTSSLSYELHIIDTSDIASTLTEHSGGDGEPLDQPTLETRSQEDREGGLQQEVELRAPCNLIDFVVVVLTLVFCALLMAVVRQNVNQDSLGAPADMRQDNHRSNLQNILVAPPNVVIQLDSMTLPPCRCTPQHQPHALRKWEL
ncbi:hypothetical protein FBULB1_1781 [Fusarium bulbicola]|nr:hypothetical protein FBULB1_1781 [Fusarium bulbicola]